MLDLLPMHHRRVLGQVLRGHIFGTWKLEWREASPAAAARWKRAGAVSSDQAKSGKPTMGCHPLAGAGERRSLGRMRSG